MTSTKKHDKEQNHPIFILGIETSCDETAASVVEYISDEPKGIIHSNIVHSQIDDHSAFGGVVPEIAARAHGELIDDVIIRALNEANLEPQQLSAIAATAGPGLMGGLLVGSTVAKALAHGLSKPYFAINHLEGHALTARLTNQTAFPYLLLLVSGGHTQILKVNSLGDYQRISTSIDDALGEAFDKTAKLLGLGFPGGPAVEKAAINGDATRFDFPKPLLGKPGCDFSFSGLKTAVRLAANKNAPVNEQTANDICASFQNTICEILENRIRKVYSSFPQCQEMPLVVAGGVAANKAIRSILEGFAAKHGTKLIAPPLNLCTDNAAMIAWAAAERFVSGQTGDSFETSARSRWPLDPSAAIKIGSGKRGGKA